MAWIVFIILSFLCLGAVVAMIITRNQAHGALFLVLAFASLGGIFGLLNVTPWHRKLLGILGLLRVLPVFASLDQAVTACWSVQARRDVERERRIAAPPWLAGLPLGGGLQPAIHV